MRSSFALVAGVVAISGCSAAKTTEQEHPPIEDVGTDLGDATSTTDSTATIDDGGLMLDGDLPEVPIGTGGNAAVYAHSPDTLYKLDPKSLSVTKIGPFVGPAGLPITDMTDIALDKSGAMYGVSYTVLYKIDYAKPKPVCTKLATLSSEFNGLTFIPAGMIDAGNEVLVGVALDGGWWRVDIPSTMTSAKLTQLGSYGGGYSSAGDAVGIIGAGVYATVNPPSGGNNHVVIVNPKTGKVQKDLGDCGQTDLWGVGYWGGTLYAFSSVGEMFSIDLTTAKSKKIALTSGPDAWWGAGVTTAAPIVQ